MNLREYLREQKLVTDGAMGTYFDDIEKENYLCSEEANIVNPALVLDIHRRYLKSGARLLRSNTFLANRETLSKLQEKDPKTFSGVTLKELVRTGYEIAQKAADEGNTKEAPVFAAADIGPISENSDSEEAEMLAQYYELCDIFLEEGADIFVLETFPDCHYVLKMAAHIKEKRPEAFVLGQFILTPTGYSRTGMHYKTILAEASGSGLLDGVGLNCGIGAAHMKKFLSAYLSEQALPEGVVLAALPNCGYPQLVRGRAVYSDSVPYFGEKLREIAAMGIQMLGGCCGTTPAYIGEVARMVSGEKLPPRIVPVPKAGQKSEDDREEKPQTLQNAFKEKLLRGVPAYAVELDPPFDADDGKLMTGGAALFGTKADVVTIADSPLARSRADSILMAAKLKGKSGMDAMPHIACRDKNRIALRSGILGAHASGLRNLLLVTGDPVAREDRAFTKSVFDFNSIRLMKFLQAMNQEVFKEDPIFYGGALNQNGNNPDGIAARMEKKMEAGCSYFLTQPVYSEEGLERIAYLKARTGAKILIGIMPLVSRRNALFIQNEMPGISVPDAVVARYEEGAAREAYEEVAVELSLKLIAQGKDIGAGIYFMTPFNRVSLIKTILTECP